MKNSRIQVGFDISKKKLDMCILEPDGQVLVRHRSFPNSLEGYQAIKQSVMTVVGRGSLSRSGYWR